MADDPKEAKPDLSERAEAARRARDERLARALRANLRRRKGAGVQAAGQSAAGRGDDTERDDDG